MKKVILALLTIITFQGITAQEAVASEDESTAVAKVYFLRTTGFAGSAAGFTAFIDDTLACKLNNKRFSVHEVAPGKRKFTVQFAGKKAKAKAEPIYIEIEAGKTYYVQMLFQTGILKNNLYCQEVTKSSADAVMPDLKEDTKCL